MSNLPRTVPWANWGEWHFVFERLYSADVAEQVEGIQRVSAWQARGKVPHSVESTVHLREAAIADRYRTQQGSRRSENELRLLYCMALTRLVNGLTDVEQKRAVAMSISVLATRIGLPQSLVDLRHDATHQALPPLSVCRASAAQALDWLRTSYWERQATKLAGLTATVRRTISKYTARRLAATVEGLGKEEGEGDDGEEEEEEDDVDCGASSRASESAKRSDDEGPRRKTAEDYIARLLAVSSPNSVVETLIPCLLSTEHLAPSSRVAPASLTSLWSPLLEACHSQWPHFSPHLLLRLVQTLSAEVSATNGAPSSGEVHRFGHLEMWIHHLLGRALEVDDDDDVEFKVEYPVQAVVVLCLEAPSVWTVRVLAAAAPLVQEEDAEYASRVTAVAHAGAPTTLFGQPTNPVARRRRPPSADDTAEILAWVKAHPLDDGAAEEKHAAEKPARRWSRVEAWTPCPIGLLEGALPDLALPVDADVQSGRAPRVVQPVAEADVEEPMAKRQRLQSPGVGEGLDGSVPSVSGLSAADVCELRRQVRVLA